MPTLKELQATRAAREKRLRRHLTENALQEVDREVTRRLDMEEYEQERGELFTLIRSLTDEILRLAKSSRLQKSLFSLPTPCYRHDAPVPCAFLFRIEGYNRDRHPTWSVTPESKHFLGDVYYLTNTGSVVQRLEREPGHNGDEGGKEIYHGNYTIHNSVLAWVTEALQRLVAEARKTRT